MKNKQHGGSRQNSGAKPRYGEPTKTVAFRIPLSKVDEVKALIKEYLNKIHI